MHQAARDSPGKAGAGERVVSPKTWKGVNKMKMYEITFMQNDTFQSALIKSKRNKSQIAKSFERSLPKNAIVVNIEIAKSDSLKPGKPCYFIL